LPLDENLRSLFQVLLGNLAKVLIEDHDPVPIGLFLALAGRLVAPAFGSGDTQVGDWSSVLRVTDFGVGAQIADQD
jgi:hypothetical protein